MAEPILKITVEASIRASNGIDITIDERRITLSKPGPRGGDGVSVTIPLAEWDAVSGAVERLRGAMRAKERLLSEVNDGESNAGN